MKKIQLTQGKEAIVDDEDYEVLIRYSWCFHGGYAVRGERKGGVHRLIRMHSFLMQTPAGMVTDHINMDKLDNRRRNLRVVTKAQNLMNRGKNKNNSSGYKGVSRVSAKSRQKSKPWSARIKVTRRAINLGYFATPEEASEAYKIAAIKYHGKYSNVN